MVFYWFAMSALSVWRITHLLQAEDGPWDLVVRLRVHAGEGFWARLLDCFYCLSLWIALPFAITLGHGWREKMLLWPALSGAACLLQQATGSTTAPYFAHTEENNVMLRKPQDASSPEHHSPPAP